MNFGTWHIFEKKISTRLDDIPKIKDKLECFRTGNRQISLKKPYNLSFNREKMITCK